MVNWGCVFVMSATVLFYDDLHVQICISTPQPKKNKKKGANVVSLHLKLTVAMRQFANNYIIITPQQWST